MTMRVPFFFSAGLSAWIRPPIASTKPGELRFIHDKLREQAYGQMGAYHRTELHHRAALGSAG